MMDRETRISFLQYYMNEQPDTCWEKLSMGYEACVFYWQDSDCCSWIGHSFEKGGYCEVLDKRVEKKSECTEFDLAKKLLEVL